MHLRIFLWATALLVIGVQRGAAFDALVIGDWGQNGQNGQRETGVQMGVTAAEVGAKFVISVGDNFYDGGVKSVDDPKWRTSFEDIYTAPALQIPWYAILGNHDYEGSVQAEFDYAKKSPRWRMPAANYRFTEELPGGGVAEFFVLDTTPMVYGSDGALATQRAWLKAALGESTAAWKIVLGHHPLYSGGQHGDNLLLQAELQPLFVQHGVQLYLCGHDHHMEHLSQDGVHHFVSGAGAALRAAVPSSRSRYCDTARQNGFLALSFGDDALAARFLSADGVELYRTEIARVSAPTAAP
jgi:tartrate-resistant acid phosphatase type 5